MKKELNYFKFGIGWAIIASIVMLVGALSDDKFPQILGILSERSSFWIIISSLLYLISNFIIFTFPAFLVYKAGELSKRNKKFTWTVLKLIRNAIPTLLFFLISYFIAAIIRGDIFTDSLTALTDYGYCIGVIVTAMLFGFKDLNDVEHTQQKHKDELKKLQKRYSTLEAKYKKMEKRYTLLKNKGKKELAKLEKDHHLEESQK
ncbi:hypothetical protein [Lysinibacillus piscis]|nr:hypothetical protein [Lysinibacillus sp. KH24]